MITILGFLFATILCDIYKIDLGLDINTFMFYFLTCLVFELLWIIAVGRKGK